MTPPNAATCPSTQARCPSAASRPARFSSSAASYSCRSPIRRTSAGRSSGRASRMVQSMPPSEPFLAALPHGVREIAIKREFNILYQRIHAVMIALDRLGARCHPVKGRIKLGEIRHFDHEMKFAEVRRCKAELLARQPPALNHAVSLKALHIALKGIHKIEIGNAGLQVKPAVINIHASPPEQRCRVKRAALM